MSQAWKRRFIGTAGLATGLLLAMGHLLYWLFLIDDDARADARTLLAVTGALWLAAHWSIAVALVGLYSSEAKRLGLLGWTGMALGTMGTLAVSGFVFWAFPEVSGLEEETVRKMRASFLLRVGGELGGPSLLVGLLLFGAAVVREGTPSRAFGALLAVGAALAPVAILRDEFLVGPALMVAAGFSGLGWALLRRSPSAPQAPGNLPGRGGG